MSILEYLYERYDCSSLDTLETRCPININNINLNNKMYDEFKDLLDRIEERESRLVKAIVTERDIQCNDKRYNVEFIDGSIEFTERIER